MVRGRKATFEPGFEKVTILNDKLIKGGLKNEIALKSGVRMEFVKYWSRSSTDRIEVS